MNPSTLVVVGAGTMGSGIAQVAATCGWKVHLIDSASGAAVRSLESIGRQLDRQVEAGRITAELKAAALSRIRPAEQLEVVADGRLAIEAVVEDLGIKQQVFQRLERVFPADAVLATNTSSLSVTRIAEGLQNPRRVIGMHFFNPVPIMPLVEVISGRASDSAAVEWGRGVAQDWGKVTVSVKDTPGFIVNRVARGFYLEALRLLGEGVAGVDEIDAIMRTHGRFKMGPFQLMDLVGLDVNFAVSTSVWEQLGRPARLAPHPIQQELVKQGHLGRKTKRGFYSYADDRPLPAYPLNRKNFELSPLLIDAIRAFCERGGIKNAGRTEQYVLSRVLGAIFNEAAFALGEEVASAADIDLAMVKGTNYPQGPVAWSETIGLRTVRGVLGALNRTMTDNRYEPAPLFLQ
jgi:3-hydroxybutyryl-CoA dehydrogenase